MFNSATNTVPRHQTSQVGQRVREAVGVAPGQLARHGRLRYCPAPVGLFFCLGLGSHRPMHDDLWLLKTPSVAEIQGFRSGSEDGYGMPRSTLDRMGPPRGTCSIWVVTAVRHEPNGFKCSNRKNPTAMRFQERQPSESRQSSPDEICGSCRFAPPSSSSLSSSSLSSFAGMPLGGYWPG